jgi:hypothetical protein
MLYLSGWISDCNGNGIPDGAEIDSGSCTDCNGNGVPDECESQQDCNDDGVLDLYDFATGNATDCNGNAIPDQCDIADCDPNDPACQDCTGNGIPDGCEPDCNNNGVADSCDIAAETSQDCVGEGIPDECEPDCNGNGIADSCDIAGDTSEDCDYNGIPDECQELSGIAGINMEKTLHALNCNNACISALIPDRFDFSEGETGHVIEDGGNNMYKGGNCLRPNRLTVLDYTTGVIKAADEGLGPGSRYFTAKYPGLFIMIATDIRVQSFWIAGYLGAAGGDVDGDRLSAAVNGLQYTVVVKRVFGAATPSVNHIFIVRGDGTDLTHTFSGYTSRDWDRLTFDDDSLRDLIYVLVARSDGLYLENADVSNIANEVLRYVALERHDCNENGMLDACDIAGGTSRDVNGNGIPDECECLVDITGDGIVNVYDLLTVLTNYGASSEVDHTDGDLDGDEDVDISDLGRLLSVYGEPCLQ